MQRSDSEKRLAEYQESAEYLLNAAAKDPDSRDIYLSHYRNNVEAELRKAKQQLHAKDEEIANLQQQNEALREQLDARSRLRSQVVRPDRFIDEVTALRLFARPDDRFIDEVTATRLCRK